MNSNSNKMQQLKDKYKFIQTHPSIGRALWKWVISIICCSLIIITLTSLLYFSNFALRNYESALLISRVNKNERVAESTFKGCVGYEQKLAGKNLDDAIYIPDMIFYGCIELPPMHLLSLDEQLFIVQKNAFELTKSSIIETNSLCTIISFYGLCEYSIDVILHLLIFSKDHLLQLLSATGTILLAYFLWQNGPSKYYKQYIDVKDRIAAKSRNTAFTNTAFTRELDNRKKARSTPTPINNNNSIVTTSPIPIDVFEHLLEPVDQSVQKENAMVFADNPGLNLRRPVQTTNTATRVY